jgi:hypothetical protein
MGSVQRREGLHKTHILSGRAQISHLCAGLTDDRAATVPGSYEGTALSFQIEYECGPVQRGIGLHLCGLQRGCRAHVGQVTSGGRVWARSAGLGRKANGRRSR